MKNERNAIKNVNFIRNSVKPLVSIIVAMTDVKRIKKHIGNMIEQTYEKVEILVVRQENDENFDIRNIAKIQKNSNVKIKTIVLKQSHGSFRGGVSENELFLCGAAYAKGEYYVFTYDTVSYTKTYIANMVERIQNSQADFAFSDFGITWKNGVSNRYVLDLNFDNEHTLLDIYIKHAVKLFGLNLTENKLISRKLWMNIRKDLDEYYSDENSHIYMGEMIFATLLWARSSKAVYVSDGISVIDWADDDERIKDCCADWTVNMFLNETTASINLVRKICTENGISIQNMESYKKAFFERLVWRTAWFKPGVRKAIEDTFNIEISEFTMGVFEGRVRDIDMEDLESSNKISQLEKNVKIFISLHKPSFVPENNKYLLPIQVGTALGEERFPDMLHDDEGKNISEKNKMYCELTAQYWAWKNCHDADYYGFWHYRRYLSFNTKEVVDEWGNISCEELNSDSLEKFLIDEEHILAACTEYDIILPSEWRCFEDGREMTVYEHWCKHFNKNDIDLTVKIILDKYPQYYSAVTDVLYSTKAVFCNMFIMKKELFQEYSAFCFGILEELESRLDQKRYNIEEFRTLGHIGERLLAIYVRYIETTRPEISINYYDKILYKDTRPVAKVLHPNREKCVSVMLACDDKYMKYADVLLQSICENICEDYFYDIVICHRNISEYNQRIAKNIVSSRKNIQIRFIDVTRNFERYKNVHIDRHLTYETYYRFLVLDIFEGYDRVLYLDCDMVVNSDIAELFFIDMNDEYVAAVRDYDFIAGCAERKDFYSKNVLKYINIGDYFDYFQAGVILFNLKMLRKKFSSEKLFKVALSRDWWFHDQDVLNCLFNGHIKYLDDKWNVFSLLEKGSARENLITKVLPAKFAESYHKSVDMPCIIHYAGVPKVWNDTEVDLGYIFWKYARKSPYYEELLQTLIKGEGVKSDWLVFISDILQNTGIKFFTIKTVKENWSSDYCILDFTFLSNHQAIEMNTLIISASMFPHETRGSWLDVKQFCWEKDNSFIPENILFRINGNQDIEIYVRAVEQYTGYSFSVRTLESRSLTKPMIEIHTHHFVEKPDVLPEDIRKE